MEDIVKKKVLEELSQAELLEELRQRNLSKPLTGVLVIGEQIKFNIDTVEWIQGAYHVEIHYVKDYTIPQSEG